MNYNNGGYNNGGYNNGGYHHGYNPGGQFNHGGNVTIINNEQNFHGHMNGGGCGGGEIHPPE